ncbi:MAG TPA: helix-turn-helix domain-containing protein [Alphaproteobacteria bacterium]|nr:helix-turn-helix domain-containing protein [Alphaproteobacteria bacterium]
MEDDTVRAAEAKKSSPFLTTAQAAFYVGLSRRTLERMRWDSRGPRYRKHGRYVRYHIGDLNEWSLGRGKSSTAEAENDVAGDRRGGSHANGGNGHDAHA